MRGSALDGAIELGGGGAHACALRADGTVRCWGANSDGQLGNGGSTNSNMPVTVSSFP